MAKFDPYLNFPGNAEEAMNFYRSIFGTEFITLQRYKDTPFAERTPPEDKEKIMHASLPIGGGTILMATDTLASMGQKLTIGNNVSIAISPESEEEANNLFNALSAGGTVTMPLVKVYWGSYFGMLTDKFGIHWLVNYELK